MSKTSNKRKPIPVPIETQLLTESRRRCCLCFHLNDDADEKQGQIAHIDRKRTNNSENNLAFLCLDHHNEYDAKRIQSKGFTASELRHAKKMLYEYLQQRHSEERVNIVITVEGDFDKLSQADRHSLLEKILGLAEIKGEIVIRNIERGSIRFGLEMNIDDAAKLTKAFNSGRLLSAGVRDVRFDNRHSKQVVFLESFSEFNNAVSTQQASDIIFSPDRAIFLNAGQNCAPEVAKVGLYLKRITEKYSILIVTQRAMEVVAAFPLNHEFIDVTMGEDPVTVLRSFLTKVGLESYDGEKRSLLRIGETIPLPPGVYDPRGFLQYCERPAKESREPFICINVLTAGVISIGIEILFFVSAPRYFPSLVKLGRPVPTFRNSFFFSPLSE